MDKKKKLESKYKKKAANDDTISSLDIDEENISITAKPKVV